MHEFINEYVLFDVVYKLSWQINRFVPGLMLDIYDAKLLPYKNFPTLTSQTVIWRR